VNTVVVSVNGRSTTILRGATVADLVSTLKLSSQMIVIEFNGEPLSRDEFVTTGLNAGDAIEIVQMVGGG
jgi:sulfur carrier protein